MSLEFHVRSMDSLNAWIFENGDRDGDRGRCLWDFSDCMPIHLLVLVLALLVSPTKSCFGGLGGLFGGGGGCCPPPVGGPSCCPPMGGGGAIYPGGGGGGYAVAPPPPPPAPAYVAPPPAPVYPSGGYPVSGKK
ncbi:hypothetical protein RB195_007726 [Necator americanus]|uniref:Uncharacterized protein n=1 Tax=Necator americanus TaxID=51031 RepID=A0ABR1C1V3_NECAM